VPDDPRETSWLSPIGAEYARLYDQVEAARRLYEEEREQILVSLCGTLENLFQRRHLGTRRVHKRQDNWADVYVDSGKYQFKGRRSGIEIAFSAWKQPAFTVSAWIFFSMDAKRLAALGFKPVSADLSSALKLPGQAQAEYQGGWGYLRAFAIRSDDSRFTRTDVEAELERIPDLWLLADEWLAKRAATLGLEDERDVLPAADDRPER
jgi:hypothetical protein